MTLEELVTMLIPLIIKGVNINVYHSKDIPQINLNTMAKSSCILTLEDGKVYANRRYGRKDEVTDLDHLIELVSECDHGRGYFDSNWVRIIKEAGWSLS